MVARCSYSRKDIVYTSFGGILMPIILQQNMFCIFVVFPSKPDEDWCWPVEILYSRTSRKRTPTGPRVSVRLREVSAYGRVKKKMR